MDSDHDSSHSNEGPIHRRRTQGTRPLPRLSATNNHDRSYRPTKDDAPYSDDDEVDDDEDEDDDVPHPSTFRGRGRPSQQQQLHSIDTSYDDQQEFPRYTGPLREQDRFLPIANIAKIMKKGVPEKGKIAKDAKETIQE